MRDFCYVDDITDGILLSLENEKVNGEIINLASGAPISIKEVIEIIQEHVGGGRPDFGKIAYRNGENMRLFADISKAKTILNWYPKITLLEGIKKTVASINPKNES